MNSESSDLLAHVSEATRQLSVQAIGDAAAEESLVLQVSKLHSVALARFGWHQLRRSAQFQERFLRAAAEASDTSSSNEGTADDSEWLELAKHATTSSDAVLRQVVEAEQRLYEQAAPQPVNRTREFPS